MSSPDGDGDDAWKRWILDAIRKIRSQKQRPSVERICHAIRQHRECHEDEVAERLERAVREGAVLKVYNKGQSSYKEPGGARGRALRLATGADLSRAVTRAVRELGERDGSSLRSVERHLRAAHRVREEPGVDGRALLRQAVRRALARGLLRHGPAGYLPAQPDDARRARHDAEKVSTYYVDSTDDHIEAQLSLLCIPERTVGGCSGVWTMSRHGGS